MRIVTLTAFLSILLDQVTKIIVVQGLDLESKLRIPVIDGFLSFRMAWNEGINFGLFAGSGSQNARWILIGVAVVICLAVLYWVRRQRPGTWGQVAAGLIIGGALGNVIDRLWYGAVADFLNVTCCGIVNPFAFNVADAAIFLGAVLLVLMPAQKGA
ncbi:signal peptidase II [Pseudooceanicola sp. CBS1P-1]|uniref:Lipoprotein signal peptidase n=1 Tax=Pseudooceanicola albus TaxID=2692189 RepID=A0A6L7G8U8_9RHOB|nr:MULTISPECIES: signal peptidase II [Pseudooceanicola]MBT9384151.1 signal peptidase II [Pseudooceanicola endophyticus]MXN19750.1 signal peptidase II [Pseudooceanicola albus]